jgi:hypothetical protein
MNFVRNRLRAKLDSTKPVGTVVDAFTGDALRIPRSRALQCEFGLFNNDVLDSLADILSIKVEVKEIVNGVVQVDAAPLMVKTVAAAQMNALLSQAEWDNGTNQHLKVLFTAEETALAAGVTNEKAYWLVVTADSSGGPISLGSGTLWIVNDGGRTSLDAPPPAEPGYVRYDDFLAAIATCIKHINQPGVGITLVNDLGYGIRIYPTPNSQNPTLERDTILPP